MNVHPHRWIEISRTAGGVYYECSCGAAKAVSNSEGEA